MKDLSRTTSLFACLLVCILASAQPKSYTPANAHSHNDYLNARPFYQAYTSGFGSIEADIFPVNGVLLVAHHKEELQPLRTLKSLYINPLLTELAADSTRRLNLLIDIKEDYVASLALLLQELEPLKPYLSDSKKQNRLTILISGLRPPPAGYKNYPDYIFFDDDLKLPHTPEEWSRVGLVSLPFTKLSAWKGEGAISRKDKRLVRHVIDSVHTAGKPIRFWAAPDSRTSWDRQVRFGADFIGTDKIEELGIFLRKKKR